MRFLVRKTLVRDFDFGVMWVAHIVGRAVRTAVVGLVAVLAAAGLSLVAGPAVSAQPGVLPAPELLTPPDGTLFKDNDPETTLTWQGVPHARRYNVEVECLCTVGWSAFQSGTVATTSFTFEWNRGGDFKEKRWRVTAVRANGAPGTPSVWWQFRYEPRPSPVLISPADGIIFTTLPRTTTLTWEQVNWAVAQFVTIECLGCTTPGQWTTFQTVGLRETVTSYTFDWPGPFRGRWHVSALPPGPPGPPPSPTWEFEYTV